MDERVIRRKVEELIRSDDAHVGFEDAVRRLPRALRTVRPPGASHGVWELVEHMRLAQHDILRYVLDPRWRSPRFPEGYWPARVPERLSDAAWKRSLRGFRSDLARLVRLARDPRVDLTAPLPHAPDVTCLEELLLAADHNAYHLGQVVSVRRALGAWGP